MVPIIPGKITPYIILESASCSKVRQNYRSMLRDMFWGYLMDHPKRLATPQIPGHAARRLAPSDSFYNDVYLFF